MLHARCVSKDECSNWQDEDDKLEDISNYIGKWCYETCENINNNNNHMSLGIVYLCGVPIKGFYTYEPAFPALSGATAVSSLTTSWTGPLGVLSIAESKSAWLSGALFSNSSRI